MTKKLQIILKVSKLTRKLIVNRQKMDGFSIIELMIVLCIIGILASISLTTYSQYTIRANVAGMFPIVDSVEELSDEYYALNNVFPSAEELNMGNTITVDAAFYSGVSQKITSMWIFGGSTGRIDIQSTNLTNTADTFRLSFTRAANLRNAVWICRVRAGTKAYAPQNCQRCSGVDNGDGTCS